jgi:hypothetical protein
MDASTKTRLTNEFRKHATQMVDIEYIAKMMSDGMDTDIKQGDLVIGTNYYEQSLFRVADLKKHGVHYAPGDEPPNPYEEWVRDNADSRCSGIKVKAPKSDDSIKEMRVKVEKLNMLGWNERTQSFPKFPGSNNIIFRQVEKSFAEEHRSDLYYFERIKDEKPSKWLSAENIEYARVSWLTLSRLADIPPFVCYWNDKYGFLVKREVNMTPIILKSKAPSILKTTNIVNEVKKEAERQVGIMTAHLEKRETGSHFKEEIVMKSQHPDRMEALLETYGMEGMEATFDPSVEGTGKTRTG